MEDLTGLDWTVSHLTPKVQKPPPMNPISYYSSLRPTPPLSGRSTPSAAETSGYAFKPPPKPASRSNSSTPANDSFANLVTFNTPQSSANGSSLKNVSLHDQQKKILEKREREQTLRNKQLAPVFGHLDGDFLESLGSGRRTPNRITTPPTYTGTDEYGGQKLSSAINKPFISIGKASRHPDSKAYKNSEVDLLSVFDSPSPAQKLNRLSTDKLSSSNGYGIDINGGFPGDLASSEPLHKSDGASRGPTLALDDDPFGLGTTETKTADRTEIAAQSIDDDDILGLLGRPVSDFPAIQEDKKCSEEPINVDMSDQMDHAMAELIDMGFGPEKSKEALESTESGTNVQAAIGWLLSQAHEDAVRKSKSYRKQETKDFELEAGQPRMAPRRTNPRRSQSSGSDTVKPAWLQKQKQQNADQRRQESRSPVNGEKDPGKYAAELGTNLFKTANSLWKTGTKKLNQAVSELNSDSDSSQPKWMKDVQFRSDSGRPRLRDPRTELSSGDEEKFSQRPATIRPPKVTDEALLLESSNARPPRKPTRPGKVVASPWISGSSSDQSPILTKPYEQEKPHPKVLHQPRNFVQKAKVTKQSVEEQASNAYISPARRKKPPQKPALHEPDLLFDTGNHISEPRPQATQTKSSIQLDLHTSPKTSAPIRTSPPIRTIPPVTSSALQTSTTKRQDGTSAFKRGDYALATTFYSSALSALPPTHPLTIVLLTNRSLAHLKTGDPKSSIVDSKSALSLIGPSRGALETIDLGDDEGAKDMQTFWAKAMTRQAEALEELERWSDAATIWRTCVEAGVGGATSIAGRNRCEKAIAGPASQHSRKPRTAAPTLPSPKPIPKSSALDDLSAYPARSSASVSLSTTSSIEAITRLRKANAAAERLDDEKFALADQVSDRLTRWRAGKEGNLRALLASLDTVLWEGAGWKKVGMGELIVPGKVKVVYMRGIGKVHPDKVIFLSSGPFSPSFGCSGTASVYRTWKLQANHPGF